LSVAFFEWTETLVTSHNLRKRNAVVVD